MPNILVRSWWVFLFGLVCYGGYDLATKKQQAEKGRLGREIAQCRVELERVEARCAEMEEELSAYEDPAFREMRLMARLGLVPKGQTKVIFKE